MEKGRARIIIENIVPNVDGGAFPAKRAVGEKVAVKATIFGDGHDSVAAVLLVKGPSQREWTEAPMKPLGNDLWTAEFFVTETGEYTYSIEAWVDHFQTWQKDLRKRHEAQQDLGVHFQIGAAFVEKALQRASGSDKNRLKELLSSVKKSGGK